uniref:IBB domain-containing protein n=1 Tax=Panagrolaimus sp. JU765 TaxID=591449 RepID=A0AC34Q4R7_9BILA
MDNLPSGSEHLHDMFKNHGRTLATQRRSREQTSIELRKKKREEFFIAKRMEFEGTLSIGSLEPYIPYSLYDDQVTEGLFSDDPKKMDFSLMVYIARLEKEPEKGQVEFWDMMSFNVLTALYNILNLAESGSHRQFLVLRILASVSEDPDIAVALSDGTDVVKYILWKFTSFDEKCMGEVLIILSNTVSTSTIPTSTDQALFLIERCRRLCCESPMSHIRALSALVMTKIVDNLEEGIQLPTNLVDFAGELIVSGEIRLRISGYCLLNAFFYNYRMGNAVVSSDKWIPALERCTMVDGNESSEIFYLLENLCNFMLPYELTSSKLLEKMWYIIEDPVFASSDKRLKALSVLCELSVSSVEKMQLLLDSNPKIKEILAELLVNANFDTRRQVLLMLRNLFLNLPHSIPFLAGKKTIEGISDLLTVMQPDTVIFALECLKAVLEHGGGPSGDNQRLIGIGDYATLAEEASVHSRLDFLVSSPNEQVALLALEILHTFVDTKEDDAALPDDLKDLENLQLFNF